MHDRYSTSSTLPSPAHTNFCRLPVAWHLYMSSIPSAAVQCLQVSVVVHSASVCCTALQHISSNNTTNSRLTQSNCICLLDSASSCRVAFRGHLTGPLQGTDYSRELKCGVDFLLEPPAACVINQEQLQRGRKSGYIKDLITRLLLEYGIWCHVPSSGWDSSFFICL
jgi:hypothetical protein